MTSWWHVFTGCANPLLDLELLGVRTGVHDGGAGKEADVPRGRGSEGTHLRKARQKDLVCG